MDAPAFFWVHPNGTHHYYYGPEHPENILDSLQESQQCRGVGRQDQEWSLSSSSSTCSSGYGSRSRSTCSSRSSSSLNNSSNEEDDDIWGGGASLSSAPSSKWMSCSPVNLLFSLWSPSSSDDIILDELAKGVRTHPTRSIDRALVYQADQWGPYMWWKAVPTPSEADEMLKKEIKAKEEVEKLARARRMMKKHEAFNFKKWGSGKRAL